MRAIGSLIVIAGLAYIGLCAWVYATQREQIYFPVPETHRPDAQVLWIDSQGERLKVWVVPRAGSRAIIYFGGNAEDVAGNIDLFAAAFPDHSLFPSRRVNVPASSTSKTRLTHKISATSRIPSRP